jgi:hypothetical protein
MGTSDISSGLRSFTETPSHPEHSEVSAAFSRLVNGVRRTFRRSITAAAGNGFLHPSVLG